MYLPPFRVPVSDGALQSLDPMDLIDSHSSTIRRLIGDHFYNINEIPHASAMAYLVEYYVHQVENGGHGQFLGNGRRYENLLPIVQEGLSALNAQPFLDLYLRFRKFLDADHARADLIAEGCGFGELEPEIERIDAAFLALERSTVWTELARFLRHQADLDPVQDSSLRSTITAIGRLNPRQHSRAVAEIETHKSHPRYDLAKDLCEAAGRRITRMGAGWQNGPGETIDGVMTSEGMVWMRAGDKIALLGLNLGDVTSSQRLPGLLAVAKSDGVAWRIDQLSGFYRRLARLTPPLRRLAQHFKLRR
ncbi:hypothetical protein PMI02_04676 [Novosphingobium sp. AP12]|nr:hypothetical protein PMI02_04676 [Novosphingobium sp. AP12]